MAKVNSWSNSTTIALAILYAIVERGTQIVLITFHLPESAGKRADHS